MPKPLKDLEYWKSAILRDWPSRAVMTLLTAFCVFAWSQGKEIVQAKVMEIVKPSLDTISKKQEITDQKVERVDAKVDALISILVEAFPQVKKAAQERTQKNRDSQDVQDALTGDKP